MTAVTDKVVGLDKSLGVSETAYKVDEKVSGGMGANLVAKGLELVNSSVEYVTDALNHAKETAASASAAPAATAPPVLTPEPETKTAA